MVSRVFIDVNVLLDLALQRDRYSAAREMFDYIDNGTVDGFISPSIVHMIAYWVKKAHGLSKVKPFLFHICNHIEVVDSGHSIAIAALKSEIKDVEDALQYCAALAHHMDIFISNDRQLKKFATSALPVLNADEFIRTLRSQSPSHSTASTHS